MEEAPVRNLPEELYEAMARNGLFDTPPEALARLALSRAAQLVSDRARSLVPTTADRSAGSGEFVERSRRLVEQANEVMVLAVVYERERGRSWVDIGRALGVTDQNTEERFAEQMEGWYDGLDQPYVVPADGSAAVSNLPDGAEAPTAVAEALDQWCERHTEPTDGVLDEDRGRQVSAHLMDERRRTRALMNATLGQGRRLLSRPGAGPFGMTPNPVAKRTYWERKARVEERSAAERPDDSRAQQAAADAREHLNELRALNLRLARRED